MSLLETRNKKFNLPFVFIAGVLFLAGLAYFANYLENLSEKVTDVEVQQAKTKKTIRIRVEENLDVFLDGTKIDVNQLEEVLKIQFEGYANPVITLKIIENISLEIMGDIMEIARKNNYEIILETALK
ncbi:biopolymer transporter ExbD [uncultured Kordia sp.]|uniref:ExbD/TolR family protein n=1 Tax=uncultured Kordia sp. TaxID=507699 RepID=UPI0026077988|nr:biopolymer transporter ExbD [uncultured Kordia sp.]